MKQTLLKLSRTWKCSAYRYIATFINIIKLSALRAQSPVSSLCREPPILSLLRSLHWNCRPLPLLSSLPSVIYPQTCNRALLEYLLRISFPLCPPPCSIWRFRFSCVTRVHGLLILLVRIVDSQSILLLAFDDRAVSECAKIFPHYSLYHRSRLMIQNFISRFIYIYRRAFNFMTDIND